MTEAGKKEWWVEEGTIEDIPQCAEIACNSEIGRQYMFRAKDIAEKMRAGLAQGSLLLVARPRYDGGNTAAPHRAVAGFAWIESKGAFGQAPYLKLIAVDEKHRSAGVGTLLLAEFERRTKAIGTAWLLLVSDFNQRAVSFYERHGYVQAGRLPSFAQEGIDEIIMYKHHEK